MVCVERVKKYFSICCEGGRPGVGTKGEVAVLHRGRESSRGLRALTKRGEMWVAGFDICLMQDVVSIDG